MSITPEHGEVRIRAAVAGRVNTLLEAKKIDPGGAMSMTVDAMDALLELLSSNPSALMTLIDMQSSGNGVIGKT
ncbi:MAG: hypothetical protein Q8R11_03325 [bacterium]|nr:hypothetical protein [bacterium]